MKSGHSMIRRFFIFFLLAFILISGVYAGGVGEAIGGALAMVGGALMMLVPGGQAVGGLMIAGGFGSMVKGGLNASAEASAEKLQMQQEYTAAYENAYQNYLNAQQWATSLEGQIADTEVSILQTEANISSFDQTLVRWQSQYDQQRTQLQMQGESAYSELMQNWQGAELVNATRGQTGGSADLVAMSQEMQVERLAGSDLKLDQNGGLFGTALDEFRQDMLAGRTELVGNMNIQRQALDRYNSALGSYKSSLATAQANIRKYQSQYQSYRDQAIAAGVDPSLLGGA